MKNNSPQPSPPAGGLNPQYMVNEGLPYIVHIDLNSCFAIIEQQANRLLRGRPVGISAYDTPRGMIIAASYQAKAKGIKLGVNVEQSRSMCPGIVIMTPDPAKYREAHRLFKAVLLEYSPDVTPKSIDEFILDMSASPALRIMKDELRIKKVACVANHDSSLIIHNSDYAERLLHNQAMLQIGKEIKAKIAESLGEYVTVNIGISTNRFLAKYAAGFGKPDGMTLIDHTNLRNMYEGVKLVDLPGINTRYRARLRIHGIYTPLDFLEADMVVLRKQVFKSINGYHWYRRLRGFEADDVEFSRKSIGHQHALSNKTTDMGELERLLIKLCEKTGRRLRKNNLYATGTHLYLGFSSNPMTNDQTANYKQAPRYKHQTDSEGAIGFESMHYLRSWHHGERVGHRLYSTSDIYQSAKRLLYMAEIPNNVRIMAVNVFGLADWDPEQLSIFDVQESNVEVQELKVNGQELKIEGRKLKVGAVATDMRSMGTRKRVSDAVDAINDRYGEFVVTPAAMMDMQGTILDRIAFGQVRDM